MAPGPPLLGDNRFALLADSPKSKRKRKTPFDNTNFPGLPVVQDSDPKFVVISPKNVMKPLNQFSCSGIKQGLEPISKVFRVINELRDGSLLILTKNKEIPLKFIRAKSLHGVCGITAKYHLNLNSSKGTVYAPCLNDVPEDEIVAELKS